MKKFIVAMCVCLAMVMLVSTAFAEELYDWHLRGVDEGLAAGALPPPGLYFINNFYWVPTWKGYDNAGDTSGAAKLNGYVDVPILLWTPGCTFFGATYGAAIAQPFDTAVLRVSGVDPAAPNLALTGGDQWGAYNTVLVPFILSWKIPCDLYVSASFAVGLNDGTTSPGDSLASITKQYGEKLISKDGNNAYAWSSNDAYTFTPQIGISWLYAGWNVSAEFMYTFWTKDTDCDIQNGDQFAADYTLTYTCEKWTFGLGAQQENQVYNDKGQVNGVYGKVLNSMNVNYSVGPIVGYNFGPCSLMFMYNFAIETKNDVGGDWFNLRLVVPLGNPCSLWK